MIDPLIDYMNASVGRPESLEELPTCPICGREMASQVEVYNEVSDKDELFYSCYCGHEAWESECR